MTMTKQQELDLLQTWINALPSDSYLRSLLQPAQTWFEAQVASDLHTDLYATMVYWRDQFRDAESNIMRLQRELENANKRLEAAHDDRDAKSNKIQDQYQTIDEQAERIRELQDLLADAQEAIQQRDMELTRLKARMWDAGIPRA